MYAIRAAAAAKAMEPYVDDVLFTSAIGAVSNAVSRARTKVAFKVDGDTRAQETLSKRLIDAGYKIDWIDTGDKRIEDSAVMVISWR